MKKILPSVILLLTLLTKPAFAGVIVVLQNQENQVPINLELGTIIQLPGAVKTVTPSRYFAIKEVGEAKTDVRTFHVKPVGGARPEAVTFVLASGKAFAFKFLPTRDSDKFFDIEPAAKKTKDGRFLVSEMLMMRAMLVDEAQGFQRELVESSVETPFEGLGFTLLRIYGAENLTGYVFDVRNTGPEAVQLNLASLGFAAPNRAVLSHADRLVLKPCPFLKKDPSCRTVLRLVVRGPKIAEPLLSPMGTPPFAKPSAVLGGSHE